MSDLLASSPVRPHPRDIEMGMPAGSNLRAVGVCDKSAPYFRICPPGRSPPIYRGFYCRPPIYRGVFLEQILISGLSRVSETFTLPALAQIEHVIRRIEAR